MHKIGRNDPCPCGSGKKYKRCCLNKAGAAPGFMEDERHSALARLEDFVEKELGPEDDAAYESFYARWEDRLDQLDSHWIESSEAVYDGWFCFDYRLSGGGLVVDLFLDRNPLLSSGERRYLELLRDTAMRLYDVEDLSPGVSVTLRDVIAGTRVTVRERLGSQSLWRHALVAARIIGSGPSGQPEIESGLLQIPDLVREQLLFQLSAHRESYRQESPVAGETEFYKEMGPFFHDAWMSCLLDPPIPNLKNTDGDDLLITRIRFEVDDPAGVEAALDGGTDLEREEGKATWLWIGRNREGKPITLGRLVLREKSLELECNSARRGERGRAMVEEQAAGLVRHRSTTHENVAMAIRDELRSGHSDERSNSAAAPEALPREVQEALTLDAQARYYRKWLDEQIPALADHTPREAAEDAALRPKLIDLIHQLEGTYQLALKNGEPAYDPSWMWSELGLEDRSRRAHPPPLAHERVASMAPGLGEVCRTAAEHVRRQPGFDDVSTILTAEEIGTNLEIQRFLRERRQRLDGGGLPHGTAEAATAWLAAHVEYMTNFELHRRKTFWVDEALVYLLAKTDLDVPGSDVRVPFPCFALVFTDRHMLSLAERMLSADPQCPLAGCFLRAATVYVTEMRQMADRVIRVHLVLDALGADPPHVVVREIPLAEDAQVRRFLESLAPRVVMNFEAPDTHPLPGAAAYHAERHPLCHERGCHTGTPAEPGRNPENDSRTRIRSACLQLGERVLPAGRHRDLSTAQVPGAGAGAQRKDNPPSLHGSRPLASCRCRVEGPARAVDRAVLEGARHCRGDRANLQAEAVKDCSRYLQGRSLGRCRAAAAVLHPGTCAQIPCPQHLFGVRSRLWAGCGFQEGSKPPGGADISVKRGEAPEQGLDPKVLLLPIGNLGELDDVLEFGLVQAAEAKG